MCSNSHKTYFLIFLIFSFGFMGLIWPINFFVRFAWLIYYSWHLVQYSGLTIIQQRSQRCVCECLLWNSSHISRKSAKPEFRMWSAAVGDKGRAGVQLFNNKEGTHAQMTPQPNLWHHVATASHCSTGSCLLPFMLNRPRLWTDNGFPLPTNFYTRIGKKSEVYF